MGLLDDAVSILKTRDPDAIVSFFSSYSASAGFIPIYPDAESIEDVRVERGDGWVRVCIVFVASGSRLEACSYCIATRRGTLLCSGVARHED